MTPRTVACQALCPWNSPVKNTGVGCHFLLQRISPERSPWLPLETRPDSRGSLECTHLNAEFQRIARRDKKAFLSDQCKEIEENIRMGKTRDLYNKIRGSKGRLQASAGHPLPGAALTPPPGPRPPRRTGAHVIIGEIPWTEEPRGLQSMGLQRVRQG